MLLGYNTKKELKECIGEPLRYTETSLFGVEYMSTGTFVGANRPAITKTGREFFAEVTMLDGLILRVK
tara:strand:+ start:249 stop:452 length:204 start_codon:yes stop_codon:yes gene_type:complete